MTLSGFFIVVFSLILVQAIVVLVQHASTIKEPLLAMHAQLILLVGTFALIIVGMLVFLTSSFFNP